MKLASMSLAFALCSAPVAARAHEGGHDARGVVTSVSAQELTDVTTPRASRSSY